MLGKNIKILRKEKDYTQEEQLGIRNRRSGRIWQIVVIVCVVFVVFNLMLVLLGVVANFAYSSNGEVTVEEVSMEEDTVLIEPE